ncbi:bifunctional diguanylate cyclase/phosphodiesterase [Glaciecola sp. KUL10]|uniref:putative bifunctional diguanylate cyclase/phosphodiesterase n=1 Tax=Glaciecola sp. (strain KUL10) TaxID=2161813 RepID=UPI000D78C61C|nr:GGDEF and EAL domain-containing protein [Glaciecola sp. KUL10]GBL03753.1 diguanylate cyclase/phosphodiesterase [Glaciecola sp. KUL10]
MIRIKGLLLKTLVTINIVALVSLAASYGFVSSQQDHQLNNQLSELKQSQTDSLKLLLDKAIEAQINASQELFTLYLLNNTAPNNEVALPATEFFKANWSKLKLSFSLDALVVEEKNQKYYLGDRINGRLQESVNQLISDSNQVSGVVCESRCYLMVSSLYRGNNGEGISFTIASEFTPTLDYVSSVLGVNAFLVSDILNLADEQRTISSMLQNTGNELQVIPSFFSETLSIEQFDSISTNGLLLSTTQEHLFVWKNRLQGIHQDLNLLLVSNVNQVVSLKQKQKQYVIISFITLTLGILITIILFSIIPISQINKLRKTIKLIGDKQYDHARLKLGNIKHSKHVDELNDLENEFRNAIDLLENYQNELEYSQQKLVRQATIDSTTGLFTRNVLIEDISRIKQHEKIAIFFLDLDGFKPVNDNLGHEAGDIILKKIGYRLKGVSNKYIKVYRIGGDEFVIAYTSYSSTSSLLKMAKAIVELFNSPFSVYDSNINMTASIGIAIQEQGLLKPDQLLRYADIAMYQAKEDGKNRYRFFDASMRAKAKERFSIKHDFLSSLNANQLRMVYQPIVCAQTQDITKLEALCRWEHPVLGNIPPLTFIDVLEESENMTILFDWIATEVVNELERLDELGYNRLIMSINISSPQLEDDKALELIKNKLDLRNISPNRVELEITETTLITNFSRASQWVQLANQLGFRVAIDDFGAGYSSLSYLSSFGYDTVKLDRSLLDRIDTDKKQQRIISSLTQMIHSLSVPIVAEGAETEQQLNMLAGLGCDYIQGYFISRPVSHHQLIEFFNSYKQHQGTLSLV